MMFLTPVFHEESEYELIFNFYQVSIIEKVSSNQNISLQYAKQFLILFTCHRRHFEVVSQLRVIEVPERLASVELASR